MKKTLLVTLDFPPQRGGVARYYDNLCRHLSGGSIVVLAPRAHGFVDEAVFSVVRRSLVWRWWPQWLPLFWHIFRAARKHQCKHIAVGQVLPVGTVVWLLSFIWRLPYSVLTHGMDVTLPQRSWRKRWLMQQICRRARFVTSVSEFTRGMLVQGGVSAEKISLLPPGVTELLPSQRDFRQEFGLEKDCFVLLTVGRLVERKGHDLVLSALADIAGRGIHNWHYFIVGTGPEQTLLEKVVVSLGLRSRVTFLYQLSDADMAAAYRACDVFVMPARADQGGVDVEGFGIVFLEAALFGKPSIASDSGGMADAIVHQQTGYIIRDGDARELADVIETLIQRPEQRKLWGEQARSRVKRDFLWNIQAQKFERLVDGASGQR